MDRNLESYVKIYKGLLEKDLCENIVSVLNMQKFQGHTFYDPKTGESSTHEEDLQILDGGSSDPNFKILMSKFKDSFNTYTEELEFPWFNKANSFCIYRYNKYLPNTRMSEHCDHIHSIFDGQRKGVPLLTSLGFLNNEFKGGDLVLFQDTKIEVEAGDMVVFPSNFMYPHRVDKVTEGVRYSVVSWAW